MKLNELFTDDRAVSPVVGVALLIAITVILAAVIGGVVLGLGTGGVDTPQAQLQFNDNTAELTHNGGEPLPEDQIKIVVDGNADDELTLNGDLTAGNSVDLTDDGGGVDGDGDVDGDIGDPDQLNSITVLWEDPNSNSTTVLEEFEA